MVPFQLTGKCKNGRNLRPFSCFPAAYLKRVYRRCAA
ncbi:unnamed protein product [Brucella canis str. Oliveri]|nr:unnamed protein product [Brucella canis str. Oliveri]